MIYKSFQSKFEYIYGRAPCEAVLRSSNREIQELTILVDYRGKQFLTYNIHFLVGPPERIKNVIDLANKRKIKIKYMKKERMEKLVRDNKHGGIIIKCSKREYIPLKKFSELRSNFNKKNRNIVVVIDRITDNFNFSNIIRSSVFLGADAIVVNKEDRPQLNNIIAKTSYGASEVSKIYSIKFIKQFISEAKQEGWTVIGTKAEKEKEENLRSNDKDNLRKETDISNKCVNVVLDSLELKSDSNVIVLISSEIDSHSNSFDFKVSISPQIDDKSTYKSLYNVIDGLNPGVSIGFIINHLNKILKAKS